MPKLREGQDSHTLFTGAKDRNLQFSEGPTRLGMTRPQHSKVKITKRDNIIFLTQAKHSKCFNSSMNLIKA